MMAGGLGFGESAAGATVTAIKAGLPVKIIGVDCDSIADILWIVQQGFAAEVDQGRQRQEVRHHPSGCLDLGAGELLLKENGLCYKDVTPVPVGTGAGLAALDHGAVDATYEYEPLFSRDEGKYRVLARVSDVVPTRNDAVPGRDPGHDRQAARQAARHHADA